MMCHVVFMAECERRIKKSVKHSEVVSYGLSNGEDAKQRLIMPMEAFTGTTLSNISCVSLAIKR